MRRWFPLLRVYLYDKIDSKAYVIIRGSNLFKSRLLYNGLQHPYKAIEEYIPRSLWMDPSLEWIRSLLTICSSWFFRRNQSNPTISFVFLYFHLSSLFISIMDTCISISRKLLISYIFIFIETHFSIYFNSLIYNYLFCLVSINSIECQKEKRSRRIRWISRIMKNLLNWLEKQKRIRILQDVFSFKDLSIWIAYLILKKWTQNPLPV